MTIFKAIFYTLATALVLAFSSAAHANKTSAVYGIGGTGGNTANFGATSGRSYGPGVSNFWKLDPGSSSTASFYYRKGVKNFEKGDLAKSEQAFRAVLRADGSKRLDKVTLYYLVKINQKQGDEFAASEYTQAYFDLEKK